MKKKLLMVAVLVALMVCILATCVSAKEYSPLDSDELKAAITEINNSTEPNVINLGGNYDENTSAGYAITTTQNLVINLTSNVEIRSRFNLDVAATVEVKLNNFTMNNSASKGGDSGCQFVLNNDKLVLKVSNGTFNIKDVCFWSYHGSLDCRNVTFSANEELIWSGGKGQEGYITFIDCNITSGGEAAFKMKDGGCTDQTRVYTIENCTFSSNGGLLIQCPAQGSVIRNCTVKKSNFTIDSWHSHGDTKDSSIIIDNIKVENGSLASITGAENYTFTNCTAKNVSASSDSSGGCTVYTVDCTVTATPSFSNLAKGNANVYTIKSPTCESAGEKTHYLAKLDEAVVVTVDEQYPINNPALGHGIDYDNLTSIVYEDGYMAKGLCYSDCIRCDATNIVEKEASASPLFTGKGFSRPESNGKIGLAVSFGIDLVSIQKYELITGKSVEFGAVAAGYDNLGANTLLDANGDATVLAKGQIIKASVGKNVSTLTLKITGFTSAYMDTKLVMGGYVIVTEEAKKEISYFQLGTPAEGDLYSYTTYNLVQ